MIRLCYIWIGLVLLSGCGDNIKEAKMAFKSKYYEKTGRNIISLVMHPTAIKFRYEAIANIDYGEQRVLYCGVGQSKVVGPNTMLNSPVSDARMAADWCSATYLESDGVWRGTVIRSKHCPGHKVGGIYRVEFIVDYDGEECIFKRK